MHRRLGGRELGAELAQHRGEQTGDLHLGDAEPLTDLLLGEVLDEAQAQQPLLALVQARHGRLEEHPQLGAFSGHGSDAGEGRWTVEAAIQAGVPTPVLASSLFDRFSSRGEADYGNKILSAMRQQFGGHAEKPAPAASPSTSVAQPARHES